MSVNDLLKYALVAYHGSSTPADFPSQQQLEVTLATLPTTAAKRLRRAVRVFGYEAVRAAFTDLYLKDLVAQQAAARAWVGANAPTGLPPLGRETSAGATVKNHPSQILARFSGARAAATAAAGPAVAAASTARPELPRSLRCAKEICAWLKGHGFERKSQVGSHEQWVAPSGHKVTVPRHNGDIAPGTLASIRRQVAGTA